MGGLGGIALAFVHVHHVGWSCVQFLIGNCCNEFAPLVGNWNALVFCLRRQRGFAFCLRLKVYWQVVMFVDIDGVHVSLHKCGTLRMCQDQMGGRRRRWMPHPPLFVGLVEVMLHSVGRGDDLLHSVGLDVDLLHSVWRAA